METDIDGSDIPNPGSDLAGQAKRLLREPLRKAESDLPERILRVRTELELNGRTGSGIESHLLQKEGDEEISRRAHLVADAFRRVVSADPQLAAAAGPDEVVSAATGQFDAEVEKVAGRLDFSGAVGRTRPPVVDLSDQAAASRETLEAELRTSLKEIGNMQLDSSIEGGEVFIVHGRDEEAKEKVARLVERLGLTAVILHEQPSRGKTIIEKFVREACVGFAVVLLTPDDTGGLDGEEPKPRARQNVIFELGFFVASIGRDRVAPILWPKVDMPTDFSGVVYIDYDEGGGWKLKLAKELQAAGYEVDFSRIP